MGDTLIINGGHIENLDSTDIKAVSNAYVLGRKIASQYLEALRFYLPDAFKNAYLVSTAPLMGVRESRRIRGEYVLTIDDYLQRKHFNDDIANNCYWIDCHSVNNKENTYYTDDPNWFYKKGETHGIPFRCLLPKGIGNLLVAGRCISVERTVLASTRVMPNCLSTDEAAGIAAALAIKII